MNLRAGAGDLRIEESHEPLDAIPSSPKPLQILTVKACASMNAAPISTATRLPRLAPSARRLHNVLYTHDAAVEFACGDETLQFRWEHRPQEFTVQWAGRVEFGGAHLWLALEYLGVAVALGTESAQLLPRALRQLVLLQAFAPAFDTIESLTGKKIAVTELENDVPPPLDDTRVYFSLRNTATQLRSRGWLQCEDAAAIDSVIAAAAFMPRTAHASARWDAAHLPLRLELGSVRLASSELARLEAGDCLLLNQVKRADGALALRGSIGKRSPLVLFAGHATARQLTISEVYEAMQRDNLPLEAIDLPLERLDAVELTLTFDVGEQPCALGELKHLQPGCIIDLDRAVDDNLVRIRIGGRLIGTGQLVAIGDQLGVRIAEFNTSNA